MGAATLQSDPATRTGGCAVEESSLQRMARGDASAVDDCFSRYGAMMHNVARRFLGRAEDAEEVVQDVFADLWRTAGRFDPSIASEKAFVMTVARRRLIDHHRGAQRKPATVAMPVDAEIPAESEADALEASEEISRVKALLAHLKPVQRRALRLALFQGLSHARISKELGMPLGTIKTHIRRALAQLRTLLRSKGLAAPGVHA